MSTFVPQRLTLARLTRRRLLAHSAIAGASLTAIGPLRASSVFARHDNHAASELPEITIVSTDYAYDMPATFAGGLVRITLDNQGPGFHHAMLVRVNDDVSVDDFTAALLKDETTLFKGQSVSYGGPMVGPGGTSTVVIDLPAGKYVAICVIPGPDGMAHYQMGMLANFEVTAPVAGGAVPDASMRIELMEMMFHGMPESIAAGPATWEVANIGGFLHELVVLKLAEGVPAEAVLGSLTAPPSATPAAAPEGPPPFDLVAGVAPIDRKQTNFLELDLAAGNYLAICMIPDPASGKPHAALGMAMPFTVA